MLAAMRRSMFDYGHRRSRTFFTQKNANLGELMSAVCGVHVRGWAGVGACSAEGGRRPRRTRRRALHLTKNQDGGEDILNEISGGDLGEMIDFQNLTSRYL